MKNPEFGSNPDHGEDTETVEVSKAVAEKKAEELDMIRKYAFRFMTVEEYETILKEQKFPEREVVILRGDQTALEFIRAGQKTRHHYGERGWKVAARDLTGHPVSTLNMNAYDIFLALYREARTEVDKETKSREEVIRKFRDKLLNFQRTSNRKPKLDRTVSYRSSWGFSQDFDSLAILKFVQDDYQRHKDDLDKILVEIDTLLANSPDLKDEVRKVVSDATDSDDAKDLLESYRLDIEKREGVADKSELLKFIKEAESHADALGAYGFDRLEIVREFINTEDLSQIDIRKVLQAIGTVPRGNTSYLSGSGRQYQVAMFFDHRAGMATSNLEIWTRLSKEGWGISTRGQEPIADSFLAAVALLPDKDLEQRMIEASRTAGEAAVPVFNRDGIRRFPEAKEH